MNINWNPSEKLRGFAARVSEEKEAHTYDELVVIFGKSRNYLIALKKLGDTVRQGVDFENQETSLDKAQAEANGQEI